VLLRPYSFKNSSSNQLTLMKKLLILIFLTISISWTFQTFGQVDTNAIKTFILNQETNEEKFIDLLRRNKIDSCLQFFSSSVVSKYGKDSLQKELKILNKLFLKYPNPVNTPSLGQSFHGVGSFGHDNDGSYEKESLYQFMDKGEVVYYFSLYYSDKEPVGLIKYYNSEELTDFKLPKGLKPIEPPH